MTVHSKVSSPKSNEQFGAIPLRAFSDSRLSAAHFRVMGVIAYHDRLGRNGQGCWVAQEKLAAAAVHYNTLSRIAGELEGFGYIPTYSQNYCEAIDSEYPIDERFRFF